MEKIYITPKGFKEAHKFCASKKKRKKMVYYLLLLPRFFWRLARLPLIVIAPNLYYKRRQNERYIIPLP
ncbi:hypothetical protein COU00_02280 [Candidatus Falkowbacteria bacterium CG10_big_fil_rev_8_21_14_0_10_43_11]|uniref:Uncharacterized protein n=1 Tax=Candidatus Falkowbacteria bacterium CG10_big_fil_rev_8_21_14_0_10_43_11 TaxID=1974568 RepID=A0A2M6WLW6_9BACT|nr:MAG: hypothetical protein COU00_02280 [Candidatus Falkowbacteria bacterium CG10_big_fil_rev_8_21_14_0_10_43_11]